MATTTIKIPHEHIMRFRDQVYIQLEMAGDGLTYGKMPALHNLEEAEFSDELSAVVADYRERVERVRALGEILDSIGWMPPEGKDPPGARSVEGDQVALAEVLKVSMEYLAAELEEVASGDPLDVEAMDHKRDELVFFSTKRREVGAA
jgi:hypothetical protein